jgi:hypothetical protein
MARKVISDLLAFSAVVCLRILARAVSGIGEVS